MADSQIWRKKCDENKTKCNKTDFTKTEIPPVNSTTRLVKYTRKMLRARNGKPIQCLFICNVSFIAIESNQSSIFDFRTEKYQTEGKMRERKKPLMKKKCYFPLNFFVKNCRPIKSSSWFFTWQRQKENSFLFNSFEREHYEYIHTWTSWKHTHTQTRL